MDSGKAQLHHYHHSFLPLVFLGSNGRNLQIHRVNFKSSPILPVLNFCVIYFFFGQLSYMFWYVIYNTLCELMVLQLFEKLNEGPVES